MEVGTPVTVEVLEVNMDRKHVSLSLKATQEDPWQTFARLHQIGQIVPGKVTKLVICCSIDFSKLSDRFCE